jgi:polar amino acid transport system substrate-binding protein
MWRAIALLLCLFALSGMPGTPAWANDCPKVRITADPAYPPLHWYDGKTLRGASIDIASRVFDDLGIAYEIKYVGPFPRVLRMAEAGEVDMISTLKITPERLDYLAFPSNPSLSNPIAVFVPKHSTLRYSRWEDLIGKRGGLTRDNKFGNGFDEFIEQKLSVERVNNPEQNFAKMRAGHIDYFLTGLYTGLAYLAEQQLEGEFKALIPYVTDTKNYSAFVKGSPCIKYLPAFDQRLGELMRSGVGDAIVQKNIDRWRQHPHRVDF